MYTYADEDRLVKPHSYMYPPLHGSAFFVSYAESRTKTARQLLAGCECIRLPGQVIKAVDTACGLESGSGIHLDGDLLAALKAAPRGVEALSELILPEFNTNSEFIADTCLIIDAMLGCIPNHENCFHAWSDFFTARFEISKRLYEAYALPARKPIGSFMGHGQYASFALLLGMSCFCKENLRWLNTLLKLNDLLCSISAHLQGRNRTSTLCAIILETACVGKLLSRIGGKHVDA